MSADTWLVFVLLFVVSIPMIVLVRRANELFVVDVIEGKPTLVRGRIPRRLLRELRDVAERSPVIARARLRATVEGNRPMLRATGAIDDARLQRMRNVVGLWSKDQIRAGLRTDQLT
jgi:hypothetical protein